MKPEIKAMMPELPGSFTQGSDVRYYSANAIEAWLDKLTEGAVKFECYVDENGTLSTTSDKKNNACALLLKPVPIKKQTPLEIAVEYIEWAAKQFDSDDLREALVKIEAAK